MYKRQPYYRLYFGKKYASGFFLEGFGMLNSEDGPSRSVFENGTLVSFEQDDDITNFALGIGVGGKWVAKNGLLGELNLGIGRNLFDSDDTEVDYIGKIAITIGYRFWWILNTVHATFLQLLYLCNDTIMITTLN